jgi:hypothetical protein
MGIKTFRFSQTNSGRANMPERISTTSQQGGSLHEIHYP